MITLVLQGMNEIVGPIYYVFATDSRKEWRGKLLIFIVLDCDYLMLGKLLI